MCSTADAVFPDRLPVIGSSWFHGFIDYAAPANGTLGAVLFEDLCNIDVTPPIQNDRERFTRLLMDFGDSYREDTGIPNLFHPKSGGRARTGIVWQFAQGSPQ